MPEANLACALTCYLSCKSNKRSAVYLALDHFQQLAVSLAFNTEVDSSSNTTDVLLDILELQKVPVSNLVVGLDYQLVVGLRQQKLEVSEDPLGYLDVLKSDKAHVLCLLGVVVEFLQEAVGPEFLSVFEDEIRGASDWI